MSISSIFNDALRYPLNNVSKWIILGIIVIIANISYLLVMFGVTDGTIQAVASLINFIVMFIVVGILYQLLVIQYMDMMNFHLLILLKTL